MAVTVTLYDGYRVRRDLPGSRFRRDVDGGCRSQLRPDGVPSEVYRIFRSCATQWGSPNSTSPTHELTVVVKLDEYGHQVRIKLATGLVLQLSDALRTGAYPGAV